MSYVRLTELISPSVLQEIQDGFANVTGMAALTTDADGVPVTQGSNFTDFCMKYTRCSAKGCKRCEECDRMGGEKTRETGLAQAYVCHAGLMDFAAPIMLNGEFIGSFIGGQVLIDEPNDDHFRQIAQDIDIEPEAFIEAVHRVNIVPRPKVESAAKFLHTIAKVLSSMAYTAYNAEQMNQTLKTNINTTAAIISEVRIMSDQTMRLVQDMDQRFASIASLVDECNAEVENCSEVVNIIQDNATTTHILGLNASIEASRAKEEGKGFGVIASEVRSLADTSKSSADIIKNKIEHIRSRTTLMQESTDEAKGLVENCMQQLDSLKNRIADLRVR